MGRSLTAPCVRAEELKAQKGVTSFLVAPLPFRVAPDSHITA